MPVEGGDSLVNDSLVSQRALRVQGALLARIAETKGTFYRLADPEEESQGIDGYIGATPVSVKPATYLTMDILPETIDAQMIVYEKKRDGVSFRFDF